MNTTCTKLSDGIYQVIFDRAESSANVFDQATLKELSDHVDTIASDATAKGVVFASAKKSIFIAGADIKEILRPDLSDTDLREMILHGQDLFNRIEALRVPTVAAIHGACLGGGLELCLACDYRLASPDRSTKIGLPETSLGILPAWGGSTRMPRLVGLPKAVDLILGGKRLNARKARRAGLVDELIPKERLLKRAAEKIARGRPERKRHRLTNNRLAAAVVARMARKSVMEKTRGHYPAALRALDVVTRSVSLPLGRSLENEARAIMELGKTEVCKNLVRVFFLQERAKRLQLSKHKPRKVEEAEVIGAGIMGAGIAQWLSSRNIRVLLKDLSPEELGRGMASVGKLYFQATRRGIFTKTEARRGLDRVVPVYEDVPLKRVDLVIEAAVENMEIKKKIFAELAEKVSKDTILATNTSALSISELAASVPGPERVAGIHFFNPVSRMQLVEVVVAEQTSPRTVQQCVAFVQKIGKLPVVVKDRPGFLVNRILMPYLIEAGHLFAHGAPVEDIDEAMLDFGMPMGPLRLIDEVGVDVAEHVAGFFVKTFGERMPLPALLGQMTEGGELGRKSGKGFYLYGGRGKPRVNRALEARRESTKYQGLERAELKHRMVLLMVNEAARCLEEEVVAEAEDVDFGMIMGTGFAPFRGGPLRYADRVGLDHVVRELDLRARTVDPRFEPCDLLKKMASEATIFYPEPNQGDDG